ncbi:TRAP transporter small permease [Paucibacter sp. M5-1]|uniref:TRAP transporter small permease n=1 Tax=Paucibacter sp. M5-1 TaxID=3015998 RepID=UPI0010F8013B|nr:TRAP transporter small permease [Paucibacter sp. M5-1]MCZ7882570.1 TRAP transporter small permease [Paucibacter sp. M5-1]
MAVLDRLSKASGAASAVALAAIGLVIAAQIVARLLGHQIPAADDFAAWAMAASAFLALPYAMRHGDHIRVTLVLQFLPKRWERGYELLASALGVALAVWAAWHTLQFVYGSWQYEEVAQGMLRVPLWIPQLAMAIGMLLLALMLIDRLWRGLRGRPLSDAPDGETARTE